MTQEKLDSLKKESDLLAQRMDGLESEYMAHVNAISVCSDQLTEITAHQEMILEEMRQGCIEMGISLDNVIQFTPKGA